MNLRWCYFDLDYTIYSEKEYVKSGYNAVNEYFGGDMIKELITKGIRTSPLQMNFVVFSFVSRVVLHSRLWQRVGD